jgi:transposase InsO family protein
MATSIDLKKLQEYPEFRTPFGIQSVINYVNSLNTPALIYPAGLNQRQKNRFDSKFEENFVVQNFQEPPRQRLFYRPLIIPPQLPPYRLNLEILYPNQHQEKLREIYENDGKGLGIGLDLFYYQVCSKYLGIKRSEAREFLKRQGDYQITRNYHKVINKPVLAKSPNERWEIDSVHLLRYGADLADPQLHFVRRNNFNVVGHNNNYINRFIPAPHSYRYCLVVVDCFSKKIFAEPMLDLTANETRQGLLRIMNRTHTIPRIIQTDNGGEFKGAFHALIQGLNVPPTRIDQIYTTSNTPTSNGLVERMNQEVRKRIKEGFVRHNDLEWVNYLQTYCDNINNQRHKRNKYTPNQLWRQGYNPPPNLMVNFNLKTDDHSSTTKLRQGNQQRIVRVANEELRRGRTNVFQVGDLVRIVLSANDAEVRERNKQQLLKKYDVVKFSTKIYRVANVVNGIGDNLPAGLNTLGFRVWDLKRRSYWLVDSNTNLALHRHYFGNELIKVPANSIPSHITTPQRAKIINRYVMY